MARKRSIEPGFFKNEDLGECSPLARLLFAGMWCWADREGRLEDRPRRLAAEILPYDRVEDAEALVGQLAERGFIERYEVNGKKLLQISTFGAHQDPHPRETPSDLPGPAEGEPKANLGQAKVPPRQARPSSPSRSLSLAREAEGPIGPTALDEAAAEEYPALVALQATLAADGLRLTLGRSQDANRKANDAAAKLGTDAAAAVVKQEHATDPHSGLGWFAEALYRAACGGPKPRTRDPPANERGRQAVGTDWSKGIESL